MAKFAFSIFLPKVDDDGKTNIAVSIFLFGLNILFDIMPLILIYIYFKYYYREGRDLQERSEVMGRSLVSSFTSGSIIWFVYTCVHSNQTAKIWQYTYTNEKFESKTRTVIVPSSRTPKTPHQSSLNLRPPHPSSRQGEIFDAVAIPNQFNIILPLRTWRIPVERHSSPWVCFIEA